jgi:hypothetical protein
VDAADPLIEFDSASLAPGEISGHDQNAPFTEIPQFLHLDMRVFGRVGDLVEGEAKRRVPEASEPPAFPGVTSVPQGAW